MGKLDNKENVLQEKVVEIKNLTKMYSNKRGIFDISFDIYKGDVFGLLGPNGSGKTTTMKILTGITSSNSGSAKIFGIDCEENHESAMENVGCLIESPAIYEYLSAYKNLEIAARYYPFVDDRRIHEVLEQVELISCKNDKAGYFSLGMKQRLGLALALISNPKLIILDEPANGLDIEGMIKIRKLIKSLASNEGITFLISSHLAHEIEITCNKAAIIYEGRLVNTTLMKDALAHSPTLEDYFLSHVEKNRGGETA